MTAEKESEKEEEVGRHALHDSRSERVCVWFGKSTDISARNGRHGRKLHTHILSSFCLPAPFLGFGLKKSNIEPSDQKRARGRVEDSETIGRMGKGCREKGRR